jgi:hypothetical protein
MTTLAQQSFSLWRATAAGFEDAPVLRIFISMVEGD